MGCYVPCVSENEFYIYFLELSAFYQYDSYEVVHCRTMHISRSVPYFYDIYLKKPTELQYQIITRSSPLMYYKEENFF